MPIKNSFAEMQPEIAAWRQDFHRHPELMYDLPRTSTRVAGLLHSFGVDEVVTGVGRSGVVGVIRGGRDTAGRVIGLRADMDALPIVEETGADHASQTPGQMHACGHDGHTSMLLAAARYLAQTRAFDGTVVLIFQPAEEGGAGGRAMVEDGLIDRWAIDEVYALHNLPGLPVGQFSICAGPIMASTDEFDITITGRGGHAAKPHEGIDPILVAAHVMTALQSVAARNIDPMKSGVISVTSLHSAGESYNVIPQSVSLRGTARALESGVRGQLEEGIHRIAQSVATAFGARAEVAFHRGYPVTVNDPQATQWAIEAARAVSPEVHDAAPLMAGEDFSYLLNERPGAYIFLGNGNSAMLHHPAYDFDDAALPYGASWLATIAEMRMPLR